MTTTEQPITLRLRKGTPECVALIEAWNQGIDAHLEAICHSTYEDCGGVLQVNLDPRDMPVLRRRLTEYGRKSSFWHGAAALLITLKKRAELPEMTPFLRAYIAAALWNSSCNETENDDRPMDEHYGPEDLAPETLQVMARDCEFFLAKHADDIADGDLKTGGNYTSEERAGHDLWLTRVGAGVGFWEKSDWREAEGERMTKTCEEMPHVETLYVGDDGKIYQI